MQYIINLTSIIIDQNVNSVNAKDLHDFMGVKSKYSDWIKNRIKKFRFVENQDFIMVESKKDGNNATIKDYYITLDMAKELSMVENNSKGREARRYFIEIEKQHRNQPSLIDGKNPHAIIRGLKSQLSQHIKKIELQEQNIQTLITENATLALPAPAVDLEPYKVEIKRLNDKSNELYELKEHFSHMAGVQVFKTLAVFEIKDELIDLQAHFLNNEKYYNIIGNAIRKCTVIEKETQENAQSLKIEVV